MIVMFCAENCDCRTCGVMISEVVKDVDAGCCDDGCLGEAVLRELRVVEMERLTVREVAVDVLRKVDVVGGMLVVARVLGGVFDVALVLKEIIRAECDVGKE